jgi:site-specific recombinase XerD
MAAKAKERRTRRAYRLDVQHFMRSLSITTPAELRQADHKAMIAWERFMRETELAAPSTIRRRLAALSSLYKHLVRHDYAGRNRVGEVERPGINRDEGTTLAFSRHRPCGPEYAGELGLDRGYSAHSVRATFIATALENGAKLEDVQNAAGHRDPGTTKLYDRRGYNPEKAASFFATY